MAVEASFSRREDFRIHATAYVAVNALLISVWALFGGEFWPLAPLLVWGLVLALHARAAFGPARS